MKKYILHIIIFLAFVSRVQAQDVVTWKFELTDKGNGEIEFIAKANIQSGWHLYDVDIPEGGPNPTKLTIEEIKGATTTGSFKAVNSTLYKEFDKQFEMVIGFYKTTATFVQRFKVTDKNTFSLKGDVRAQACNDETCTPPIPIDFEFSARDLPATLTVTQNTINPDLQPKEEKTPEINTLTIDTIVTATIPDIAITKDDLWRPVIKELEDYGAAGSTKDMSLLWVFILGFGGGLLALLTPCVWPMLPMTVSFFLKRNKKNKGKAIKDTITYGLSIIVIYVASGLIISAIFGPSALNNLSTSAVFNLLFFALLVVFGISFLGAFDITLPSSWVNKIDQKADSTTGLVSIFFMAFTLVLVSFSCTGPIIGTLIVDAFNSGQIIAPATGMFGFALALSIPFSLFAIFPSWLENMPKSGGWLNSVKVVLGFIELALALKFLSVADLAYEWGILDREVFLVLWIVIFILLGIYLLGKLKLPHDSDLKHVSVPRIFMAIASFAFAIYMIPGLWGAPLKAISAFSPPLFTQDFNLYDGAVHAKFDDYETGMEYARKNKKPVIIDFTGAGCVNCRKMEASVWTDSRVKSMLENDYVLITLWVDAKRSLPEVIEVEENGRKSRLKTIGDKWSYLQRHKFGTNSQPYYVLLDNNGYPIGPSRVYNENIKEYIDFLETGLRNYKGKVEGKK